MGGGQNAVGGGGPAVVRLGVTANPLVLDGGEPSASDVLQAELTAYAAGVGAIELEVPWTDLDGVALTRIEQRVKAYADRELAVILTLLVVDGAASYRPSSTVGDAWDDPATVAALESTMSDIFARTEANLAVVLISRRADVYAEENPAEATALTNLHAQAIEFIDERAPNSLSGVGVAFLAEPRAEVEPLMMLGEALVLSYLPGLGDKAFPVDTNPAKALDDMLALAAVPGSENVRPIVLQALGYPSSAEIAASPEGQMQQLEAFFNALEPRRAAFPYVNVHQLHDLDTMACDALLVSQGLLPSDPWGPYMCSTGLRGIDSSSKLAWQRFLEAAAVLGATN